MSRINQDPAHRPGFTWFLLGCVTLGLGVAHLGWGDSQVGLNLLGVSTVSLGISYLIMKMI